MLYDSDGNSFPENIISSVDGDVTVIAVTKRTYINQRCV